MAQGQVGLQTNYLKRVLRRFWEGYCPRVLRRVLTRGLAMGFPRKRILRRDGS